MRTSIAVLAIAALAPVAVAQVPTGYQIQRIGLYGPDQTGFAGEQNTVVFRFNAAAQVAGYSVRYQANGVPNGQDAWVWDGLSTRQIGLTGGVYSINAGYQTSLPNFLNVSGQVAGYSLRYPSAGGDRGRDAWVWNGTTTLQLGYTGGVYLGAGGYQFSEAQFQNNAGQIAGYSNRISNVNTTNGRDAWVWNAGVTQRIGLTAAPYTGSAGLQSSTPFAQNVSGQVAGYSARIAGLNTDNGQDAWAWNGTTTQQIGLTGTGYTTDAGYRYTQLSALTNSGLVTGFTWRATANSALNGQDAWLWNGTTTQQIGFTGGVYTGSQGRQSSQAQLTSESGRIAGISNRYLGVSTNNGADAWLWYNGAIQQIGLTGLAQTGSGGYRRSVPEIQNVTGVVAGYAERVTGVNTLNGRNTWVWNGTTTQQVGLTGAVYTGTAGYQNGGTRFINAAGQVVGYTNRITGVDANNGQDIWVTSGTTTRRIGLEGAYYTGSASYQFSLAQFQNAAGIVTGYTSRITGLSTINGQDAWYFDPVTGTTHWVTRGLESSRASDNFGFSEGTILTDAGFLLGVYQLFPGGVGAGEQRAFIYRPDLGLTDLGALVAGGLSAQGWSTLLTPRFSDALNTIVGYGYVNGQSTGLSAFVMTIPSPGGFVMMGLWCVGLVRRRR